MNTLHTLPSRRTRGRPRRAGGFTMVELMVSLVLGLLVAGAAVAALLIGRQGYTSTDASTQLRENARFAASLIERIAVQAGFQDVAGGEFPATVVPGVQGFNNAVVANPTALTAAFPGNLAHNSRNTGCAVSDTSCVNGSDVLVLRYWGVSNPPGPGNPADGSMVNCAGIPEPERASGPSYSVFHVERTTTAGEPTLVCSYQDAAGNWKSVPLVTGVEGFQVMYGTDGVTAGACAGTTASTNFAVATAYMTAPQLDAAGVYCANNWSRVRSIRIGLLMRGPVGSAGDAATSAGKWQPLAASGAAYTFSTTADVGSTLTVPADRRLRQQLEFTIHLRNQQF